MNNLTVLANRLASMIIGVALAMIGMLFIVLGITFLPVIGILMAIPVMAISFYFLNPKFSADTLGGEMEVVCEEGAPVCMWPGDVRPSEA